MSKINLIEIISNVVEDFKQDLTNQNKNIQIKIKEKISSKNGKYIFCLPGSPSACKDAWNEILIFQLDNRHKPCNFVEIMPRLLEHVSQRIK